MQLPFADRQEAGRALAGLLENYASRRDVVVLALPRGGVPVGFEVAAALHAPLDVFIVRKLGMPGHEELGLGAIASGGTRVINGALAREMGISPAILESVAERELRELERREQIFRHGRPALDVRDRVVILVDDGLATGATMMAAVRAVRQLGPLRVVVAVPVGSDSACEAFRREADEVVCAHIPRPFFAVGEWYQDFTQTTDEEVVALLDRAAHEQFT
jgi:predicted phosphoribosyltransferase